MFLGEYQTKFSGKGRVILPRKFRKELDGQVVILSRGFEGCIWGFTKTGWEKEAEKQLQVSTNEKEGRDLRRYLFSGAEIVEIDAQGRFVIPGSLVLYASLLKEVVLVGMGDRFEIWNLQVWQKLLANLTKKNHE